MNKQLHINKKSHLIKFFALLSAVKNNKTGVPVYTTCRNFKITNILLNNTIHIYNGKKYNPLKVNSSMLNYKLGSFSYTKKLCLFRSKKKKKKNFKK